MSNRVNMSPIQRRLVLGVVVPLGGLALVVGSIYMAHSTGHYYPLALVAGTVFIGMGVDVLIFGISAEANASETMIPRTKVFLGTGVVAGLALYGMLEKGMI